MYSVDTQVMVVCILCHRPRKYNEFFISKLFAFGLINCLGIGEDVNSLH